MPHQVIRQLTDFWAARPILRRRPIVVGVSGGADSLVLLHWCARHLPAEQIHAVTVDHRLRVESAAEAQRVASFCRERAITHHTYRVDVAALATAEKMSVETAARMARYQRLARTAIAHHTDCVLVAHHADDQAETVLMHLLRGSGMVGLRGMAADGPFPLGEYGRLRLLRPLLGVPRTDIDRYVSHYGLQPIEDPSNQTMTYTRNRIRRKLLPILAEYNPRIRTTLAQTADIVTADYELVTAVHDEAWSRLVRVEDDHIIIHLAGWRAAAVSVQRGLLRRAMERLAPQHELSFEVVEQARQSALGGEVGQQVDLGDDVTARLTYTAIRVSRPEEPLSPTVPLLASESHQRPLSVPGRFAVGDGWRIIIDRVPLARIDSREMYHNQWVAYLSASIGDRLFLRGRRPGERFQPLGMAGHVKLQDLMVDRKMPAAWRDRWPLLTDTAGVLWVVGHRLAARAAVKPTDSHAVRVAIVSASD